MRRQKDLEAPLCCNLATYLNRFDKTELIDLIVQLCTDYPRLRQELSHRQILQQNSSKILLQAARCEIEMQRDLASSPDTGHRYEMIEDVDLSRLGEYLCALLAKGRADDVLDLGKALVEAGLGKAVNNTSKAMRVVFQALPQSTLSTPEQMMWATDIALNDDYSLLDGEDDGFWDQDFSINGWSEFADLLNSRIAGLSFVENDPHRENYRREQLFDRLIEALAGAGRNDEIIPLCEHDVVRTDRYERLVAQLLYAGRVDEAKTWINKGIEATHQRYPGIARQLRRQYLELCEQAGDWLQVAAISADDFFRYRDYDRYEVLQEAAKKAGVWPVVRQIAKVFLATGRSHRDAKKPRWPLPEVAIVPVDKSRAPAKFPVTPTLIDIALAEQDIDKALYWFEHQSEQKMLWYAGRDDEIAEAIAQAYPDKAMAIWLRLANANINQAKQSAYESAAGYLSKIKNLTKKLQREQDWQTILTAVRRQHKRKRNMMAILDRTETV